MLETCILAILSALGVVLLFWCAAGFLLLPCRGDGYCVLYAQNAEVCLRQIHAYRFLFNSSLVRMPMYVVDCGLETEDTLFLQQEIKRYGEFRFYSLRQWLDFLETERKEFVS